MVHVVDDDAAVRHSLGLLLKSVGLPISPHVSAREFLATYAGEPGCLVLDICMPGMSGLELQQHLNFESAIIPVVFITGHGDVPMAVEAMRHGAFDFLEKPFHDQDLIDRVRRAFEKDARNRRRLSDTDGFPGRLESLTTREREVLRLVDGPFSQSSCAVAASRGTPCTEGDVCGLRQMWQEVQGAVDNILFTTSFADLCARTKAPVTRGRPARKEELARLPV